MKKLTKALMVVTAIVMAFSVSAMAACDSGDGNDSVNPDSPEYVQPVKNSDVKKIMDAFAKQSFKAVGMESAIDRTSTSLSYDCDAQGNKIENAEERNSKTKYDGTNSQKINIATLESDVITCGLYKELDKDGNVIENSEYYSYGYDFTRGGKEYIAYSQTEITDFSNVEYEYVEDVEIPPQVMAILAALPEAGVPADMMTPVTAILRLGDIYGGASYSNKKLTINYNKVAYKLYTEVLTVIDGLNDNTTVGELIAKTPVKNLLQSLTYGIDAKEIYDEVVAMFTGEGSDPAVKAQIDKLPKPAEKETVYAYLVKLLESKDVAELIFSIAAPGMPASAIAPIADFKISEIITMIMGIVGGDGGAATQAETATAPSMAEIKTMLKGMINQYVTITEDKVTVNAGDGKTEISALEVVFNVGDDYTVSSISVSADIAESYSSVHGYGYDGNSFYTKYEESSNVKFTATVELSKTEYTLKTINTSTAE